MTTLEIKNHKYIPANEPQLKVLYYTSNDKLEILGKVKAERMIFGGFSMGDGTMADSVFGALVPRREGHDNKWYLADIERKGLDLVRLVFVRLVDWSKNK